MSHRKEFIPHNERHCYNCKDGKLLTLPQVGAKTEADHYGFIICESLKSTNDHVGHLLTQQHACEHWRDWRIN